MDIVANDKTESFAMQITTKLSCILTILKTHHLGTLLIVTDAVEWNLHVVSLVVNKTTKAAYL